MLSKNELKLLEEELIPLNLEAMQDSEVKTQIENLVNMHNPKNLQDFSVVLKKLSLSKEEFFDKAFHNTLDKFFEIENNYFTKEQILTYKDDFLYLMAFDILNFSDEIILANYFSQFLKHLHETFKTLEILQNSRDNAGTVFFSGGYKEGTDKIYKQIKENLNPNNPIHVTSQEDTERLKVSRFYYRTFRNHIDVANFMIMMNALYDFNNLDFGLTKGQKEGFEQSFSFLNGLKTTDDTLIRSFIIKIAFPYKTKKINKTKLCTIIKNLSREFFEKIVFDKEKKQYKIGISPRYLDTKTYIKTAVIDNLIYAYDNNDEYTYLWKMNMDSAINLYSKMLIEEGYEHITKNKAYKSLLKKIFSTTIFPI